jgi:glycosyltransferase involved in cell wall biosynthesis
LNISINLITNEPIDKVRPALENFQFADEVVLLDTGSKENLKSLASEYKNVRYYKSWFRNWFVFKVFLWSKFRFLFLFNVARNYALSKSTKGWILILDTDERVVNPKQIEDLITNYSDADAFRLLQVHKTGKDDVPCSTTRLWRNGLGIKYDFPVHETVDTFLEVNHLRIVGTDLMFEHWGFYNNIHDMVKTQRVIDGIEYQGHPYKNYYLGIAYAQGRQIEKAIDYFNLAIQDKMAGNIQAHAHVLLADAYKQYSNFYKMLSRDRIKDSLKLAPIQNLGIIIEAELLKAEGKKNEAMKLLKTLRNRDCMKTDMHQDILLNKGQVNEMISKCYQ